MAAAMRTTTGSKRRRAIMTRVILPARFYLQPKARVSPRKRAEGASAGISSPKATIKRAPGAKGYQRNRSPKRALSPTSLDYPEAHIRPAMDRSASNAGRLRLGALASSGHRISDGAGIAAPGGLQGMSRFAPGPRRNSHGSRSPSSARLALLASRPLLCRRPEERPSPRPGWA